jgi:predicted transport protein
MVDYVEIEPISIKASTELNEQWVQERIANNPKILGLGDLDLKGIERVQPRAGRLDLLLQDSESKPPRRYEVEIQLGASDESHIIRTIEYWDIERRRYPQYDHCAVIIAEDITSRFLNVIGLFNGTIPLIAIKMTALKLDNDRVGLTFISVLDEMSRGLVDDDEEGQEATDRDYWLRKAAPSTVEGADKLAEAIRTFAPGWELNYNKHYIGLKKDGRSKNFIIFVPKKQSTQLEIRIPKNTETDEFIEKEGLENLEYDSRYSRYRLRLTTENIQTSLGPITELMRQAFEISKA